MTRGENIIFVGGVHRSGTTMVQRILNSHPEIYGGTEFDRLKDVIRLRELFHKSIDNGRISNFFDKSRFDEILSFFIEDLLSDSLKKSNKKFISEKTPSNTLVLNELINVCPNAKFIFIIRNPKAIYASMKEVKQKAILQKQNIPWFSKSVGNGVDFINQFWKSGFEAFNKHNDKVLLIKYEDVILESEVTIKKICSHIGVEFNVNMLNPNNTKFDRFTDKDNIFYDSEKLNRDIDTSGLNKWEKKLSDFEKSYIDNYIVYNDYSSNYRIGEKLTIKCKLYFIFRNLFLSIKNGFKQVLRG